MDKHSKIRKVQKAKVLDTLGYVCAQIRTSKLMDNEVVSENLWPTTRYLSDCCGESIYTTRIILLRLVDEGKVIKSTSRFNNSLHWFLKSN